MSKILEKLKITKPAAAKLAEAIEAAERGLAALAATLDQAEAAAVDAAHDPDAYREALAYVSEVKAEHGAAAERLERLRKSHQEQWALEQSQFIERLRDGLDACQKTHRAAVKWSGTAIAEEEQRHKQAIEAIQKKVAEAHVAVSAQESMIARAERGLCEADVNRARDLRRQRKEVSQRMKDSGLEVAVNRAAEFFRNAKFSKDNPGSCGLSPAEAQSEFDAAKAAVEQAEEALRPLKEEHGALNDEIALIESKAGGS